jgi:hypothetical protein
MALSHKDATIVMGMLARDDHNQDIAAWFGENPARVVEVANGQAFGIVAAAPAHDLPPKGAIGPKARRLRAYAADALATLKANGAEGVKDAIKELEEGLKRFNAHEG